MSLGPIASCDACNCRTPHLRLGNCSSHLKFLLSTFFCLLSRQSPPVWKFSNFFLSLFREFWVFHIFSLFFSLWPLPQVRFYSPSVTGGKRRDKNVQLEVSFFSQGLGRRVTKIFLACLLFPLIRGLLDFW